jgi:uncharacterized protein (TIGR02145 family)
MKRETRFIDLLLITALLIATDSSCKKTNDPVIESQRPVILTGSLKDIDGNVYKTVKIGSQEWMAENLKTTMYNDSTQIANVTSDTQWILLTTGAYCNYDNLESNAASYGRLYNWYAVSTGKLAPAGWHIPTNQDWMSLENYLVANGYNYDGTKDKIKLGKSLAATTGWALSDQPGTPGANPEGNNSTGFTALPGGLRGVDGLFHSIGDYGFWWSSNSVTDNLKSAYNWYLCNCQNWSSYHISNTFCGLSVRLVKD